MPIATLITPAEAHSEKRREEEEPCRDCQHNGLDHGEIHVTRGAQPVSERTCKRVCKTV